jgi:hypothetical protein
MFWLGVDEILNALVPLADADRAAEIEWLRTAFAPELRQFEEFLGSAPAYGWGLVSWVS